MVNEAVQRERSAVEHTLSTVIYPITISKCSMTYANGRLATSPSVVISPCGCLSIVVVLLLWQTYGGV